MSHMAQRQVTMVILGPFPWPSNDNTEVMRIWISRSFWTCFVVSNVSSLIHLRLWTVQLIFSHSAKDKKDTGLVCHRGGMPGYGEKDCASTGYFAHWWLDFPFAHQHHWCWVCAGARLLKKNEQMITDSKPTVSSTCLRFVDLSKSFKRCHAQRSTSKDGVFKAHNSVAPPEEEVRIPTRIVNLGMQQWQTWFTHV